MKVILQQDVQGHGKKGQLVTVSDGYGRNFLLPRKLAIEATSEALNVAKQQEKSKQDKAAREKDTAKQQAAQLSGATVKVAAKAGGSGKLFGSVTTQEIAAAVQAQLGFALDKQKIVVPTPIRTMGTHEVSAKFGHEVSAGFFVLVHE
jgi:large subunit ribosomal protein L9